MVAGDTVPHSAYCLTLYKSSHQLEGLGADTAGFSGPLEDPAHSRQAGAQGSDLNRLDDPTVSPGAKQPEDSRPPRSWAYREGGCSDCTSLWRMVFFYVPLSWPLRCKSSGSCHCLFSSFLKRVNTFSPLVLLLSSMVETER